MPSVRNISLLFSRSATYLHMHNPLAVNDKLDTHLISLSTNRLFAFSPKLAGEARPQLPHMTSRHCTAVTPGCTLTAPPPPPPPGVHSRPPSPTLRVHSLLEPRAVQSLTPPLIAPSLSSPLPVESLLPPRAVQSPLLPCAVQYMYCPRPRLHIHCSSLLYTQLS